MNKGTKVKYFHSKGTRTDSNGRTYYEAVVVDQNRRDKQDNKIYVIRPEHTEHERLVIKAQVELL